MRWKFWERARPDGGTEPNVASCAWCGRYRVHGEWVDGPQVTAHLMPAADDVSHGICPDCIAKLRTSGHSR
jgi:hypothetical protein